MDVQIVTKRSPGSNGSNDHHRNGKKVKRPGNLDNYFCKLQN